MMNKKNIVLIIVVAVIVISIGYLENKKPTHITSDQVSDIPLPTFDSSSATSSYNSGVVNSSSSTSTSITIKTTTAGNRAGFKTVAQKISTYDRAKDLVAPLGYINTTDKFNLTSLVGKKVILVDFWTYSCINCQRTIPYLNAWYQKYKDQGLEIIGVHTPEFDFEKNYDNVAAAVKKFGINYPVVLDSNNTTASVYGMRYWPEEFLIDIDGFVVDHHIGEGGYADTEKMIQNALKERAAVLGDGTQVSGGTVNPAAAVGGTGISPETYFGSNRNDNLGSGNPHQAGIQTFSVPASLTKDTLYLDGSWNIVPEYAESNGMTKIVFKYHGSNVYFVASSKNPMTLTLKRDGQPLGSAAGDDVKNDSVTVGQSQLYSLIKESAAGDHTLEIDVPSSGLDAYTFTFG